MRRQTAKPDAAKPTPRRCRSWACRWRARWRRAREIQVPNDVQGVVVTDVDPDSPAGDKNFRPGDVIVEVQSQAVRTPDDVAKRLDEDAKAGKKIEMLLVSRAANRPTSRCRSATAG
jgi:serine protease Do